MEPDVHRVVDAGCGTGIASRLFTARGCEVVGVEADLRMAELARAHGLHVEVSHFEDWEPPMEPFDLVIAAQAWHWVDPVQGAVKAAAILRPGGRFAAFWNDYAYEPDLLEPLEAVYREHAPQLEEEVVGHKKTFVLSGVEASDAFSPVEVRTYEWDAGLRRDAWLDQLATRSSHRTMDPRPRAAAPRRARHRDRRRRRPAHDRPLDEAVHRGRLG